MSYYVIILLYYNQSSTSIYFALLYMSAILQYIIIIRANLESAVHIFNHKVFWPREYKLFICIYYRYICVIKIYIDLTFEGNIFFLARQRVARFRMSKWSGRRAASGPFKL